MTDHLDSIIDLPRWEPKRHPRMPLARRAAQFAPFAALPGLYEAIAEVDRQVEASRPGSPPR